jgi:hypothetical protein
MGLYYNVQMKTKIFITILTLVILIGGSLFYKSWSDEENTVSFRSGESSFSIDLPPEIQLTPGDNPGEYNLEVNRPDLLNIVFVQLKFSSPVDGYKWHSHYGFCDEIAFSSKDGKLVNNKDCTDDTKIVGQTQEGEKIYKVFDGDAGWLYTGLVVPLQKKDMVVEMGFSLTPNNSDTLEYDWKQAEIAEAWLIDILKTVR